MKKAKLKDISLDKEDAALFNLKGDLLLKATAIKQSILPKLNVILEEAISRIRKIYGIEVFKEHSIIHSAPNFRQKRNNDLKIDYNYAFWGLGASRQPIWDGYERVDNEVAKIIPFIIGYGFSNNGLTLVFDPLRFQGKYTNRAQVKFLNFLLKNIEYIETIQSLSKMLPHLEFYPDDENIIKPFSEVIIEDYKKEQFYHLPFTRTIKCPINYDELNSMVMSFVIFFPVYFSMLEIAQNKRHSFRKLISKLSYNQLSEDYFEEKDNLLPNTGESNNIDETKFVKTGIRWQVFERDNFKCLACGKSSHEGAILHVDHIIPRSKGGKDVIENYQTLCHLCNIGKSNKSSENLRNE
jgi:hypothetical protein